VKARAAAVRPATCSEGCIPTMHCCAPPDSSQLSMWEVQVCLQEVRQCTGLEYIAQTCRGTCFLLGVFANQDARLPTSVLKRSRR
jgi:hypothetical protein